MFRDQNIEGEIEQISPSVRMYLDKLLRAQALVLKVAQECQKAIDVKNIQEREEKRSKIKDKEQKFEINSFVLLRYPAGLGGAHRPPSKLHTKWQGPFKVVGIQGDQYTLLNLVTMKTSQHHKKDLAPFKLDAKLADPVEIAARDLDEYIVEAIVDHKDDFTQKSLLQFKVRWAGLDESLDTWESE